MQLNDLDQRLARSKTAPVLFVIAVIFPAFVMAYLSVELAEREVESNRRVNSPTQERDHSR